MIEGVASHGSSVVGDALFRFALLLVGSATIRRIVGRLTTIA
jgi:hypothetical protein